MAQTTITLQVYNFEATWIGQDGIETGSLAIQAECQADAMAAAAREINGVNAMADCLIGMRLLHVLPYED